MNVFLAYTIYTGWRKSHTLVYLGDKNFIYRKKLKKKKKLKTLTIIHIIFLL